MVGAQEHRAKGLYDLLGCIETATSFRRTQSTQKNDTSSRSHAICRVRIDRNTGNFDEDGLLYLIDLAGSEAAHDVATHGAERMRETREINAGLSVLKDCIRGKVESDALAAVALTASKSEKMKMKKPHVPFRQSALTKRLKHVFDPAGTRTCKTVVNCLCESQRCRCWSQPEHTPVCRDVAGACAKGQACCLQGRCADDLVEREVERMD